MNSTVLSLEDLLKVLASARAEGKKIVTTNGIFDMLHVGHARYLQKSKTFGDLLIVLVNSDASTKENKGPTRPVNAAADRAEVVAALKPVDYVTIFNEKTPLEVLTQIQPDIHVKGGDYAKEDLPEAAVVEQNGGRIEIVPLVPGYSTTKILENNSNV